MITIDEFTDIGVHRDTNEDNYIYFRCTLDGEEVTVASVCDGMGGLDSGEYASREVCESLKRCMYNKDYESIEELRRSLTSFIKEANRTIFKTKTQYGKQCGTTITCVVLADKGYVWHVGDSRLIQVKDDNVEVLTKDHTYVKKLLDKGKITEEQAKTHPKRSALTNAIGVFKDVTIDAFTFDYKDSTLVLATDGFYHGLNNQDYKSIANGSLSLQGVFEKVTDKGETDNITALTVRC